MASFGVVLGLPDGRQTVNVTKSARMWLFSATFWRGRVRATRLYLSFG